MTAPKPKDVLPLAQEITRLEQQLAEAKRKWNVLFGIEEAPKRTRESSGSTLAAKVQGFLDQNYGVLFTISSVAKAVEEEEMAVGRALYRLARLGKIDNPARGKYAGLNSNSAKPEQLEGE